MKKEEILERIILFSITSSFLYRIVSKGKNIQRMANMNIRNIRKVFERVDKDIFEITFELFSIVGLMFLSESEKEGLKDKDVSMLISEF